MNVGRTHVSSHLSSQQLFRDQRILLGAKCKSGSEAKEVEFLRRLHSVCLTFLMRADLPFPQNYHWKHLLEKVSRPRANSTGNQNLSVSSCEWRSQGSSYCNSVHLRPPHQITGNPHDDHSAIQNHHATLYKSSYNCS